MVVLPSVRVNVHAISAQASTHQSLTLNPQVPLTNALAPAMPALGVSVLPTLPSGAVKAASAAGGVHPPSPSGAVKAASAAGGVHPPSPSGAVKAASAAEGVLASPFRTLAGGGISHLHVVRNNQFMPLSPQKTAAQQGISDGDTLSFLDFGETTPLPTYHEIQKKLFLLQIKEGDLEEVLKNIPQMADQELQDKRRDRSLRYILNLFAFLVVITLGIIIVDALNLWGFQLTTYVRKAFSTSVLGEVATLVAIAFRYLFSSSKNVNTNAS